MLVWGVLVLVLVFVNNLQMFFREVFLRGIGKCLQNVPAGARHLLVADALGLAMRCELLVCPWFNR